MKETNDEDKTGQSKLADHSRRDFIVSAATAVAGVSAANLLNLQPAERANAQNSVAIRTGPYLTEGMAAYSPTGPHELMKFQRRALGPNDVAIKIHYCGICHSDIHMIPGDWGKIQYPVNPGLIDTQIARDRQQGRRTPSWRSTFRWDARAGPRKSRRSCCGFCSPGASYVVGHAFTVDGGSTVP